jgi:hypothetical protein
MPNKKEIIRKMERYEGSRDCFLFTYYHVVTIVLQQLSSLDNNYHPTITTIFCRLEKNPNSFANVLQLLPTICSTYRPFVVVAYFCNTYKSYIVVAYHLEQLSSPFKLQY